ncbi:MAG: RelA/SpoT family protein [Candidatus Berkelbacteria bacterium]|nr:RelA/SpoT family protein [Candidatus Berkelbacteria bacterium]
MENISSNKAKLHLVNVCKQYLGPNDLEKVEKAIKFSENAHKGIFRKSGEEFVTHPIQTAIRLAELHLDVPSIIAALLHDVLEDTQITGQEIKKLFGSDVLNLVESLTKLSKVRIKKSWFPFSRATTHEVPEFERQVETLRKMLVAMSKDVRVMLIKLSDKIHNLKTLKHLPEEKRERIAKEAIEIYAPIAGRLGMGNWRGILEDSAFPFAQPDDYKEVKALAILKIQDREVYLKKITQKVSRILKENNIKCEIDFRAKRWYSLFKKLQKYDNDISKIYDLIAVRIIVNSIEDCYTTLGLIHGFWRPLIGRIKDYIALPKPNGYKSIHTTVFCDNGQIVEFQIRTKEMDYQAEFGIASHWIYSEKKSSRLPQKDELKWLNEFNKIQKNIKSPADLIKSFEMDFFKDRIFVFTPLGDVKDLPLGSTPVDFAYYIHTDVGNKCAGAKINGKIAQLSTKLQNGDIVEILKKKSAKPRHDWLNFVTTEMARSNIKRYLK